MSQSPTITDILTIPMLNIDPLRSDSAAIDLTVDASESLRFRSGGVSIGLVINHNQVFWGDCLPFAKDHDWSGWTSPPSDDFEEVVRRNAAPLLIGRDLDSFGSLAKLVDELSEMVTITRLIPRAPEAVGTRKVSRRALLTGKLPPVESPPQYEIIELIQPIHPAVRYAISLALIEAFADVRSSSVASTTAEFFGVLEKPKMVPMLLQQVPDDLNSVLGHGVAAVGRTVTGLDVEAELGKQGELLQGQIRHLKTLLSRDAAERAPVIHVDANGGLGDLTGNQSGKLLGTLFGLEQAAKPFQLRVVDPVRMKDRQSQIEKLVELKEFLRMRKLSLQLGAKAWIDSADDAAQFAASGAVDLIHIVMPAMGSIHVALEAAVACRRNGAAALLDVGPKPSLEALRTAAQAAIGIGADLICAGAGPGELEAVVQLHNVMGRATVQLVDHTQR